MGELVTHPTPEIKKFGLILQVLTIFSFFGECCYFVIPYFVVKLVYLSSKALCIKLVESFVNFAN